MHTTSSLGLGIDNYGRNRQIVNVLRLKGPMSTMRIKRSLVQNDAEGFILIVENGGSLWFPLEDATRSVPTLIRQIEGSGT